MEQMEIEMSESLEDNMQMKSAQAGCAAPFEECATTLKALSLPEILQDIFSYLDAQSKGRAAQVSWLWHDNIERPRVWSNVRVMLQYNNNDPSHYMIAPSEYQNTNYIMNAKQHCSRSFPLLTKLIISDKCIASDKIINLIVQSFRNLVSLTVNNSFNSVSDLGLTQIIDNLKSLRHLDLSGCYNITDKGVAALCGVNNTASNGNLPILHSLSLPNNHNLTDDTLKYLSIGQPEIRSLNLSGCIQMTDRGLEFLIQLVNLHVLKLDRCIRDNGMVHLSQMKNLADLNLSSNFYITSAGLDQLVSGDSQLASLIFAHCTGMNDQCGPPLARLTNLTKLILDSTNIGDTVLQSLANGEGATVLDTLNLKNCGKLTNAAGPSLARLSNLTKLILTSTNIGDTVLQCLANGHGAMRLDTLDLRDCVKLTNAAGPPLARLTNLTKLILDSTNIGDTVLESMGNGVGIIRLDTLSLQDCCMLTNEAGRHLAMMSNLRVLDLSGTNLSNAGLDHLLIAGNLRIETLNLARCKNVTNVKCLAYLPRIETCTWTPLLPRLPLKCRMAYVEVQTMMMNHETGQWIN